MDVFISWAGERSQQLADGLHNLLSKTLQELELFSSNIDINKGKDRLRETMDRLNSANIGIICLTPENLQAPWVLFESGAIYRTFPQSDEESAVCTYILDMEPSDLEPPLTYFETTEATKSDTFELIE
ncbi:MAG: TIR domain-containing protein, partial [Flavobacteriales bacterium]